jgi:hypothetical protein
MGQKINVLEIAWAPPRRRLRGASDGTAMDDGRVGPSPRLTERLYRFLPGMKQRGADGTHVPHGEDDSPTCKARGVVAHVHGYTQAGGRRAGSARSAGGDIRRGLRPPRRSVTPAGSVYSMLR